jgi:hypothetical protein
MGQKQEHVLYQTAFALSIKRGLPFSSDLFFYFAPRAERVIDPFYFIPKGAIVHEKHGKNIKQVTTSLYIGR